MKKTNVIIGCLIFVFLVAMCSCSRKTPKDFYIRTYNPNLANTSIQCDSINMISNKHAEYWVNGNKMNLYAENISVESN